MHRTFILGAVDLRGEMDNSLAWSPGNRVRFPQPP